MSYLDRPKKLGPHNGLSRFLQGAAIAVAFFCLVVLYVRGCEQPADAAERVAARPDAVVRMVSPSGCSGGVIHASREHGIWIATCRHCVARSGARVSLHFFQDGRKSQPVEGVCVRSHPSADCSILWCDARGFAELPGTFPLSKRPVRNGQVVYAAGSFAGGTVVPVARKLAITDVARDLREFTVSDSAWGGHSGGPVIDRGSGELVGVLWGKTTGRSLVTSNAALWETLILEARSQRAEVSGQALYSVPAETADLASLERVRVTVSGTDDALRRFRADVSLSHLLSEHVDWIEQRTRGPLEFRWEDPRATNHKSWRLDHWPGEREFVGYLNRTGIHLQCPGGNCYPDRRQPRQPSIVPDFDFDIFGGRDDGPPPYVAPPPPQNDERLERLESLIGRLVERETQPPRPPAEAPKAEPPSAPSQEALDRQADEIVRRLASMQNPPPPPGEKPIFLIEGTAESVGRSAEQFDANRKELRDAHERLATVLSGEYPPPHAPEPAEDDTSLDALASDPRSWMALLGLGGAGYAVHQSRRRRDETPTQRSPPA